MTPFSDELKEKIERLEDEKSLLVTELNLKHNVDVRLHHISNKIIYFRSIS